MDTRLGRKDPTVSVVLPYSETKGREAIKLYNDTERTILPWQEALIYDIMAMSDEGVWTHQKFGFSIPRRNGKSEMVLARCIYGLKNGEKILYTAHRTSTTHSIWERLDLLCEKADVNIKSSYKAMGKEHLHTYDGGKIEFRTRTSSGGLGEGYDLLIIDEAQEYTNDQQAALKYTVTDSANPQTIMLGTPPTALSAGTVFTEYRKNVLEGGGYESGWAEWSVKEVTDPHDVDAWYESNPSLGYHLKERTIRSEIGEDKTDFNIQRLGLWLKYNQKSAITAKEWDALQIGELPNLVGPLHVGIKYGYSASNVAMSIAAKTNDGKVFAEAIDCVPVRAGNGWIIDFLRNAEVGNVSIDGDAGDVLIKDLKEQGVKVRPQKMKVGDVSTANTMFEQSMEAGSIVHMDQESLRAVATNCEKRSIGSHGGFGYQSQVEGRDISLLDSFIIANWTCLESKERRKQKVRY